MPILNSAYFTAWLNRHNAELRIGILLKSMPILNSAYFTAWYDDMTSAFGKVCRIKNRHTFKSMPILNSAYFTECRFVIRHITQTETQTETELLRRHPQSLSCSYTNGMQNTLEIFHCNGISSLYLLCADNNAVHIISLPFSE